MLQGTNRRMDAANFGSFQPSMMTLCLPSQYHHHHPHHLNAAISPDTGFRPYGSGNPSAGSVQAAVAAAAADLSLFQPMGDAVKHPAYGGSLSGGSPHKLMSIIGKSQPVSAELDRSVKARAVPSMLPHSPSSPPHPFLSSKEVSGGPVAGGPVAMHPSLSPWFMQQHQQQQAPLVSAKKRRQLSESASGKPTVH